jgi:hypothetical protein
MQKVDYVFGLTILGLSKILCATIILAWAYYLLGFVGVKLGLSL